MEVFTLNYNIQLIKNDNFTPTYWSGGMASELITFPENSSFAERNFLWRMGCAKIDIDTSNFSTLPGVKRHLMVTDGEVTLIHKDKYSKTIKPFDQDFFIGDWNTTTKGRCSVLNLMTRENYDGKLDHINIPSNSQTDFQYVLQENSTIVSVCIHPLNSDINSIINDEIFTLSKGELLCVNITDSKMLPDIKLINNNSINSDIAVSII